MVEVAPARPPRRASLIHPSADRWYPASVTYRSIETVVSRGWYPATSGPPASLLWLAGSGRADPMAAQPPRASPEEFAEFVQYTQLSEIADGVDPSAVLQEYIEGHHPSGPGASLRLNPHSRRGHRRCGGSALRPEASSSSSQQQSPHTLFSGPGRRHVTHSPHRQTDRQSGSDLQPEIASPRDQHIYVPVRWIPTHYQRLVRVSGGLQSSTVSPPHTHTI